MARFLKKRDKSIGLPPGSMVFVGNQKEDQPRIRLIDYCRDDLYEEQLKDLSQIEKYLSKETITWINIDGLHDIELMTEIKSKFNLHSLVMEDVMNTGQRPKIDDYDENLYLVLKMLMFNEQNGKITAEQISFVIGKGFLLTFQERKGDFFDPLRERIRKQKGRVRSKKSDYLAYSIIDIIIDNYIRIIESIGEKIEDLENELLNHPETSIVQKINHYKQEINYLRKTLKPVRELVIDFIKSENDLLDSNTIPYLKDLEDHITIAVETLETYREVLSDYLNIYNTNISNRLNDVMKVLTIFASIFIPLTFLAGIYGMNFEYIPELKYEYAYFILLGIMLIAAVLMLFFFKRKKWL